MLVLLRQNENGRQRNEEDDGQIVEVDQEVLLVHVSNGRLRLSSVFPPEPMTSGDDVRERRRYRGDTRVVARVHEPRALILVCSKRLDLLYHLLPVGISRYDASSHRTAVPLPSTSSHDPYILD